MSNVMDSLRSNGQAMTHEDGTFWMPFEISPSAHPELLTSYLKEKLFVMLPNDPAFTLLH